LRSGKKKSELSGAFLLVTGEHSGEFNDTTPGPSTLEIKMGGGCGHWYHHGNGISENELGVLIGPWSEGDGSHDSMWG
jgi:hypothetical protein